MMDEELKAIRDLAGRGEHLHQIGSAVVKLCDYIAEMEKELTDLETRIADMEDLREVLLALED
jgi:phage shock protein A